MDYDTKEQKQARQKVLTALHRHGKPANKQALITLLDGSRLDDHSIMWATQQLVEKGQVEVLDRGGPPLYAAITPAPTTQRKSTPRTAKHAEPTKRANGVKPKKRRQRKVTDADIIAEIEARGATTIKELSAGLSLDPSDMHRRIRRLRKAGKLNGYNDDSRRGSPLVITINRAEPPPDAPKAEQSAPKRPDPKPEPEPRGEPDAPEQSGRAIGYLVAAGREMQDRAASRDTPEGERSVGRCVAGFNGLFGDAIRRRIAAGLPPLDETLGWEFMSCLKKARKAGGAYREDDYVDDIAYTALSAESSHERHQHDQEGANG